MHVCNKYLQKTYLKSILLPLSDFCHIFSKPPSITTPRMNTTINDRSNKYGLNRCRFWFHITFYIKNTIENIINLKKILDFLRNANSVRHGIIYNINRCIVIHRLFVIFDILVVDDDNLYNIYTDSRCSIELELCMYKTFPSICSSKTSLIQTSPLSVVFELNFSNS